MVLDESALAAQVSELTAAIETLRLRVRCLETQVVRPVSNAREERKRQAMSSVIRHIIADPRMRSQVSDGRLVITAEYLVFVKDVEEPRVFHTDRCKWVRKYQAGEVSSVRYIAVRSDVAREHGLRLSRGSCCGGAKNNKVVRQ